MKLIVLALVLQYQNTYGLLSSSVYQLMSCPNRHASNLVLRSVRRWFGFAFAGGKLIHIPRAANDFRLLAQMHLLKESDAICDLDSLVGRLTSHVLLAHVFILRP